MKDTNKISWGIYLINVYLVINVSVTQSFILHFST